MSDSYIEIQEHHTSHLCTKGEASQSLTHSLRWAAQSTNDPGGVGQNPSWASPEGTYKGKLSSHCYHLQGFHFYDLKNISKNIEYDMTPNMQCLQWEAETIVKLPRELKNTQA